MTDWLVPFRPGAVTLPQMRTRSGMQYGRGGRSDYGPFGSRRAIARRQQFRRGQSFIMQRRRRQTQSGMGITTQHDERRIYRKKRMPRRQRRRWKLFKNKVLAVSEKDLGTRTIVFNKFVNWQNTSATGHVVANVALYAGKSANTYLNDLNQICADEIGAYTVATGVAVDNTTKFIFKSGVLDLTFRNSSLFTADGVTYNANPAAKLETDVYELLVRHSGVDSTGTYNDVFAMFQASATDTKTIGGAGTGIAINTRGCCPFDLPAALSKYGIKILKKTKFMTPNGDTFTYQVRDPRRHVGEYGLISTVGVNMKGWTRWIFIISKLVAGLTVAPAGNPNTYVESLDIGITRKYFYKIEGVNEDRDEYHNL